MNNVLKVRDLALKKLANKLDGFYLAGGTALSLFYFQHRDSFDLDFFTKEFSRNRIEGLISTLARNLKLKIELITEQEKPGFAKLLIFSASISNDRSLKIDFIEDFHRLLEPLKIVDGIPILSIQDIYFRKILTACGSIESIDQTGRTTFAGGRQEAKDFFDLYFLSNTYMPLSKFVDLYCQQPQKESIIIWFRSYKRLQMKAGLTEIITDKKISYQEMERHFKAETEKIVSSEL
jgi:predicted nucleotidyltransferase component of viral defense system